jgi:hypothetical protein
MQVNRANYEKLKDVMFELGFPGVFDRQIMLGLETGDDQFRVGTKQTVTNPDGSETVNKFVVQNFELDRERNWTFLQGPLRLEQTTNGETKKIDFRIFGQRGFEKEKMLNIAAGRPVLGAYYKNNAKIERWFYDSGKVDEKGVVVMQSVPKEKINVALELGLLPLGKLTQEQKEVAIHKLYSGERIPMPIVIDGKVETQFVEPSVSGGLKVTDKSNNRVILKKENYEVLDDLELDQMDLGPGQEQGNELSAEEMMLDDEKTQQNQGQQQQNGQRSEGGQQQDKGQQQMPADVELRTAVEDSPAVGQEAAPSKENVTTVADKLASAAVLNPETAAKAASILHKPEKQEGQQVSKKQRNG